MLLLTHKSYSGLSLIELMIVVLITTIVCSFGLPFTRQWYQHHYGSVMVQDLKQAIQHAATEALTRGEIMLLKPCLGCTTWSEGLSIVTTSNDVSYQWRWSQSAYHVTWHGFISNDFLRFSPNLGQSALNGYFLIQEDDDHGMKVVLNRVGRIRVETM